MNYFEINASTNLKNIYVLKGDDYLIKETINKIANVLNVKNEINFAIFNDENFSTLELVNSCNQFSFFNEKRIIVIQNINQEIIQKDKNLIQDYVNNPNKDCYLLISDNFNVFSFLKDVDIIECKPSDKFVFDYVKLEFEKCGKKIEDVAVRKLIEYCSYNLTRILIEIKKICDYANDLDVINLQVIEENVAKDIELKVFDLTNYLAQKNIQKSHETLYNMLNANEPPIKVLGLISGFFRRMFFAKITKGQDDELAKNLGCKPFAIKKAREQASGFSAKELKDIQQLILEIDYNIKNGIMTPENSLYYLIFKITKNN